MNTKEIEPYFYSMKRPSKEKFSVVANQELEEPTHPFHTEKPPSFIQYLKDIAVNSKAGYYFHAMAPNSTFTYSDNLVNILGLEDTPLSFKSILGKTVNREALKNAIRNMFSDKTCQQLNVWLTTDLGAKKCVAVELKVYDHYIVATAEDITLQKEYESNLQEMNQELEAFLYKSSHNLKGPTASISGLVSIAMDEIDNEAAVRYLKMIRESTDKLNFVLNDLLNVNKIKLGHIEYLELDINAIFENVMDSLKFFEGSERVKININLNHQKQIVSDQSMLHSIFQNLIENSIKYCSSNDPYLSIDSTDTDQGVEFTFSDNGLGIPQDAQDKIFNMFYRANDSKKGSGLGLYIVKTAIQKLGGTILLTSELGHGTTFKIYLPANDA